MAENRVSACAQRSGLGARESTGRVNSRRETSWLPAGIPLVLGIPVGLFFLLRADALPIAGKVVFALMGALFFALGVSMALTGIANYRRGRWLVHLFTQGIVMERTRRAPLACRYGDLRARLVSYVEPGDSTGGEVEHLLLKLTFPDGSDYAMAEPLYADAEMLRTIAVRCGAEPIESVDYRRAVATLAEYGWG